jgi:hypothetical protein
MSQLGSVIDKGLWTLQAEATAPFKPAQCARDDRGRVSMEDLTDQDLDYGFDVKGLAALRRRLTRAVGSYNGACRSTRR